MGYYGGEGAVLGDFFYKNKGKMQFSLCKYLGSKIFFANLVR